MADYYSTLGVKRDASADEIKKAYRKLAHQHHPDKAGGDEATFKAINEAYSVLGDPEKRRQYDQFGRTASGMGGGRGGSGGFDFGGFGSSGGFNFQGSPFEDLFSEMFTGGGRRERAGSDIQVDVEISFEEMVQGVKRDVRLRKPNVCTTCHGTGGAPGSPEINCVTCSGTGQIRRTVETILGAFAQVQTCGTCHGRGKTYRERCNQCRGEGRVSQETTVTVSIPAGIEDGQVLSVAGAGAAGEHGARSGDLLVVVHVKLHPHLTRRGDDIHSHLVIQYPEAVLGASKNVDTIEGPVSMKIPPGTQPGEIFRIRNKGVPHLGRFGRGDHLVQIKLQVPKKVSSRDRKLLETLAAGE